VTPYTEHKQGGEEDERIYLVTDGLKSQQTKETYRLAFQYFLTVTVKSQDLRVLLDTKPSVIESKIISHVEYLRDVRKLKYWSIQVYCSAILHFFEMNDMLLNTKKIKRFLPLDESQAADRPYSVYQIQQILDKCDVRSRVIILLMSSTGMRVGALSGLRLSDISKINEYSLYLIWVYNRSKKDRYYTFCTPECAQAIDDYLGYRKRLGEELKDKSPLIRNKITVDNPFTTRASKFISDRAIEKIVEDLLKEAGLGRERKQVMRTHGFRKFFANQCSRAQVDYPTREYLIGHKLPGQEPSYNRMTEEDRLVEYMKAAQLLTIRSESRLEQQIQELQSGQLQNIHEVHKKWEEELKGKYSLIPKREWECMKGEMKFIREYIIPTYNMQRLKKQKPTLHFDSNYNYMDNEDEE
jgi:integrase